MQEAPARDIVLYPSRWKMALTGVGALVFVLLAPLVWGSGDPFLRAVAVADVLFFGACAAYALLRLLSPRPSLVLDDVGVTDNASATGAGLVRWEEIEDADILWFGATRFLVLEVRDPEAVLARQSPWKRSVMRANLGMVGSPVTIPGTTPMPLDALLSLIQARLAARR